jgi:hypothetical protein
MRSRFQWLFLYGGNWITLSGVVLVTTAAILWLFLLPTLLRGSTGNPYLGILTFGLLPAVFFAGLILIPVGAAWAAKRRHAKGVEEAHVPPFSVANPDFRRIVGFFAVTTALNIVIGSQLAYSAVGYFESNDFCGKTCHSVMQPEFDAHKTGAHANVECVACHVSPGAAGFAKAKMNGMHQLLAIASGHFNRPLKADHEKLPPVEDTCLRCHSVESIPAERMRVSTKYNDDEANTPSRTVLVVYESKIHKMHAGKGPQAMACIECHNRPTHRFDPPERAVDAALASGEIDRALPFARKYALQLMSAAYGNREEATREIEKSFAEKYRESEPARHAAKALSAIYLRNVYPDLKLTWNSYPNNLGHTDAPGCFACHDGKAATQDCGTCHNLVSMEEPAPKVLSDLGWSK